MSKGVFGGVLKKASIPSEPAKTSRVIDMKKLDIVADNNGFISREREATKRRNFVGPTRVVNVKLPIDVHDRFMKFCNESELTVRKAIEQLLDETGR